MISTENRPARLAAPSSVMRVLALVSVAIGLAVSAQPATAATGDAQERAARDQLIHAGHITPPGKMTWDEADTYLDAYEREHDRYFTGTTRLLLQFKLHDGYIAEMRPGDMEEPEWIRRSGVALNVLSLIPVARMATSIVRSLSSRIATAAAGGLTELRAEAQQAVARAVAMEGAGSGPAYGSRVHRALREQIQGSPNLRGEVSYLRGREVDYGRRGSIRLDIIAYSEGRALAIFDLKTGSARLTARRIRQIQHHVPPRMKRLPIEELRIP